MSTHSGSPQVTADLPRVGFWRRLATLFIDCFVVILPFQAVAAILFAVTAGTVQMYNGFTTSHCEGATSIPQSLSPAPPHDANVMQVCRISVFGATTGVLLTVGRVTKDGAVTTSVYQSYMLDANGDPVDGIAIDWIAGLALLVYLVWMISKTGKTVGDRLLGVKVLDTARPEQSGVAVHRVVARYLAMGIGLVPGLVLLVYLRLTSDGSADAMFAGNFLQWLVGALLIYGLWCLLLIVQIARKKDPAYDRLAGTMVVRNRAL